MRSPVVEIKGKRYPGEPFSVEVPTGGTHLDLSSKMLVDLDFTAINSLRALESLDLSCNDFHGLRVDLKRIESCPLRFLDLHGDITLASEEPCVYDLVLGRFPFLESLDVYQNALTTLDLAPLADSTMLRNLDISWNHLSWLDVAPLARCENLESLSLEANQLADLSSAICSLDRLESLKLSLNKLATLPDCIGKMASLKRLELSSNPIQVLPESFSELGTLTVLKISSTTLKALPSSVSNLRTLVVLEARQFVREHGQHVLLTRMIEALSTIKYIDLSWNKLETVPEQLRPCTGLTHLNLDGNDIASLPGWLDGLPGLKSLGLEKYKGRSFPDVILGMEHLEHLRMAGVTCPFPDGLLDMPSLKRLAVSKERMQDAVIKRLVDRGVDVYAPDLSFGHVGRMHGALWELEYA